MERLLAGYRERLRPLAERVVGRAAGPLSAADGLGRIAAEAQRAFAKADVALVDAGSFRARIDAGPITYAELFETQAYDHPLVRMQVRGAELRALLDTEAGEGLFTAGVSRENMDPAATYSVVANVLLTGAGPFPELREAAERGRELGSQVEALAAYVEKLPEPIEPGPLVRVQAASAALYVCRPELVLANRRTPEKSNA